MKILSSTNLLQCLCNILLGHLQEAFVLIPAVPKGTHGVHIKAVLPLTNSLPAFLRPGDLDLLVSLATVLLETLLFLGCLLLPGNVTDMTL